MAEVKAKETQETAKEDRVPVTIPYDKGDKFVSVNGKNFILPAGKTSMVPPEIAAELRRAMDAESYAYRHSDELAEQGAAVR